MVAGHHFHARMFAPRLGIAEDPATGRLPRLLPASSAASTGRPAGSHRYRHRAGLRDGAAEPDRASRSTSMAAGSSARADRRRRGGQSPKGTLDVREDVAGGARVTLRSGRGQCAISCYSVDLVGRPASAAGVRRALHQRRGGTLTPMKTILLILHFFGLGAGVRRRLRRHICVQTADRQERRGGRSDPRAGAAAALPRSADVGLAILWVTGVDHGLRRAWAGSASCPSAFWCEDRLRRRCSPPWSASSI